MTDSHNGEALEFKAEVKQLLNILSRSLYKERDIFLRELISNASDALNRLQFEMLTNSDIQDPEAELAIRVDFDTDAKTLTVSDSGIGMDRDELIENLGTIAHSGVSAFLKGLEDGKKPDDIIGQFGVGFYAVFMVADEVRVTTRSYRREASAWQWTSRGDSTYTLTPAEKADRGTRIEVQLKEDAGEFAAQWRLEQIIRKHSDYVSFPIYVRDKVVNRQTALWRKSPSEVEEEAYTSFYQQLTLDSEEPLLHVHVVSDVPVDVRSILYIPRNREHGLLRIRTDYGLRLYSRKILIQDNNKDMLPEYLRFVEGIVDSSDIPLNVARETVQSNRTLGHIRKALRGRLLKALKDLGDEHPEDYAVFWRTWGAFMKEGIATDAGGSDELLPLLRFSTSKSGAELASLADYRGRMKETQSDIYYILGDSLESVADSPHMDYFRAQDLEVLYLVDPLDAFMVQGLGEYDGKQLRNVDDPDLVLPETEATSEPGDAEPQLSPKDKAALLVRFRSVLGDRVVDVRESKVLKENPCRLVSAESGPERDMQRVRRLLEESFEMPAKVLEVNLAHSLIRDLSHMLEADFADPLIDLTIEQLFENLLLLDGWRPNPSKMVSRIQTILEQAAAASTGREKG